MTDSAGRLRRALGVLVVGALLTAAVLGTGPAVGAPAPAKCPHPSLAKQVRQADVVFRGTVDKARPAKGKGTDRYRTYKVTADRVYRSSLVADSVIVTAQVGAKCPPPTLREGKRYIFFVTERGARLISTPATARATKKLTGQVVAKLGPGLEPRPAPPVTVTFSKVAGAAPAALSRLLAPGAALLILSLLGLLVLGRLGRRTTS